MTDTTSLSNVVKNTASVSTQKPIQVRKISQLAELAIRYDEQLGGPFAYYAANNNEVPLNLDNAYIMIGYPSSDNNIPHNYKFSLNKIIQFCYTSTNVLSEIYKYIDNSINYTTAYFLNLISYYHTNSDTPIPTPEEVKEYLIHYYWNGAEVGNNIKDLEKLWNPDLDR